jgi:hypothetical protein
VKVHTVPVSTHPTPASHPRSNTCTSSSGMDTPPLTSYDSLSLSDGSPQSSIDLSSLNIMLSNATHSMASGACTHTRARARARGHDIGGGFWADGPPSHKFMKLFWRNCQVLLTHLLYLCLLLLPKIVMLLLPVSLFLSLIPKLKLCLDICVINKTHAMTSKPCFLAALPYYYPMYPCSSKSCLRIL